MPRQIVDFLDKYRIWLQTIDQAFATVRYAYPEAVPCHAGCSRCCYALFAIPVLDGFLIWHGIRQLEWKQRQVITSRCKRLFREFQKMICPEADIPFRVETVGWDSFDQMVESFQRPCPFLTDAGWCGVYEWRPRICRLAGTIFRDPLSGVVIQDFCPVADDARQKTEFQAALFDISAMDGRMQVFREEFKYLLTSRCDVELRDGHTFPMAGMLEATDFLS